MAAVLAAGDGAVLSHRSAAAHWGIRQDSRPATDVTVGRAVRSRPRITIHRGAIAPDEITTHDGIPVTTVPRTIFDLASERPRREVERALHEAEVRRLHDRLSLHELVARYPNRPGIRTIKLILAARDEEAAVTHAGLEELFHAFLVRHGLPLPKFNQRLEVRGHWYEVDCVWHEQRVIAELDGRAVHDTDRLYESDRVRDRRLHVARWRPIRITWRQLKYEAAETAADLRVLLA